MVYRTQDGKVKKWVRPFLLPERGRGMPDLGGLTAPSLTGSSHFGPFNKISRTKVNDFDEPYRQHDIGYARLGGTGLGKFKKYVEFNDADLKLIRDLSVPSRGGNLDDRTLDFFTKLGLTYKWFKTGNVKEIGRVWDAWSGEGAFEPDVDVYEPEPVSQAPGLGRGDDGARDAPSKRGRIRSSIRYEKY